jgi:hypothetical protein
MRAQGGDGEVGGDLAGMSRMRSGVPVGRGEGDARQVGPARQRENREGARKSGRADGPGERLAGRAHAGKRKERERRAARGEMGRKLAGCVQGREKKGEERGCGPPVGGEKERKGEEKGGQLG